MMKEEVMKKLAETSMACVGYGPAGLPLWDDDGFRDKKPVEDLDREGEYDPLVKITRVPTRSPYVAMGIATDPDQYIRLPVENQLVAYNETLKRIAGWQARVWDGFRGWQAQRNGFVWGMGQVAQASGLTVDDIKEALGRAINGSCVGEELATLEGRIIAGDKFFSMVMPKPYEASNFAPISRKLIGAAANLGVVELALDPYALMAHNTAAVVDLEWIDENGQMLNTGSPDNQGIESAFPFTEEVVATTLADELAQLGIEAEEARMFYYRKVVGEKPFLQQYLADCGVDWQELLTSDVYLRKVWNEIKSNRRIVVSLAIASGLLPYGREGWHFDGNNAYGGVAAARGFVSGAGGYAVYTGQDRCAYGCATALYERLTSK